MGYFEEQRFELAGSRALDVVPAWVTQVSVPCKEGQDLSSFCFNHFTVVCCWLLRLLLSFIELAIWSKCATELKCFTSAVTLHDKKLLSAYVRSISDINKLSGCACAIIYFWDTLMAACWDSHAAHKHWPLPWCGFVTSAECILKLKCLKILLSVTHSLLWVIQEC